MGAHVLVCDELIDHSKLMLIAQAKIALGWSMSASNFS